MCVKTTLLPRVRWHSYIIDYGPTQGVPETSFHRYKLVPRAEDLNLSRGLFQNSLFQLLLAFDAVPGPRHSFQPLGIDFFAAGNALPKTALAEALQRTLNHLQQLPVIIALVKEKFLGVRAGSAVGDILGRILIYGSTILLRTRHRAAQLQLPRFQPLLEIVQFLFVHG